MMRDEVAKVVIEKGMVKVYDFIDLSYSGSRLKEIKKGFIHKQMTGNISPCIKTNIQNYGVVVYDEN